MKNIEKGNKVKLKSIQSPEMLVEAVGKWDPFDGKYDMSQIWCIWFVGGENKGEWFDVTNLEVIA